MRKAKETQIIVCSICKEDVEIDKHVAIPRDTCNRIRVGGKLKDGVEYGGKFVKSPCEVEKGKRYQAVYRQKRKDDLKSGRKRAQERSFAISDELSGQKKIEKVKRNCLKCGKKFKAEGKYIRICESCTRENRHYNRSAYRLTMGG